MRVGLDNIVAILKEFFQLKGSPKQVMTDLVALFSHYNKSHPNAYKKMSRAINHLNRLLKVLDDFLVPITKLSFETSLVYPKEFASGLCFQIVGVWGKDGKKRKDCIAFGGRYDSLIQYFENRLQEETGQISFTPRNVSPELSHRLADRVPVSILEESSSVKFVAVGLTLAVDKIIDRSGNKGKEERSEIHKLVDTYVVSPVSMFSERIQITTKLWQAGVKTDFVRNKSCTLTQQKNIASRNARYIVQLDEDSYYVSGMLKIIDAESNKLLDTVHRERLTTFMVSKVGVGDSPHHISTSPNVVPIKTHTTAVPAYSGRKGQQIRNSYFASLGLQPSANNH